MHDIDQVVNKSKDIGINKFIFPAIHSKYNKRMIELRIIRIDQYLISWQVFIQPM